MTSIANDYGIKWEPQSLEEPSQKDDKGLQVRIITPPSSWRTLIVYYYSMGYINYNMSIVIMQRGSSFESSNKFISQSIPNQQPVKKASFNEVTNLVKVSESFSVPDTIITPRQSFSKPRTPGM